MGLNMFDILLLASLRLCWFFFSFSKAAINSMTETSLSAEINPSLCRLLYALMALLKEITAQTSKA